MSDATECRDRLATSTHKTVPTNAASTAAKSADGKNAQCKIRVRRKPALNRTMTETSEAMRLFINAIWFRPMHPMPYNDTAQAPAARGSEQPIAPRTKLQRSRRLPAAAGSAKYVCDHTSAILSDEHQNTQSQNGASDQYHSQEPWESNLSARLLPSPELDLHSTNQNMNAGEPFKFRPSRIHAFPPAFLVLIKPIARFGIWKNACHGLMSPNVPAQARRANGVRLSTEARSRRCLQPACYMI